VEAQAKGGALTLRREGPSFSFERGSCHEARREENKISQKGRKEIDSFKKGENLSTSLTPGPLWKAGRTGIKKRRSVEEKPSDCESHRKDRVGDGSAGRGRAAPSHDFRPCVGL